MNERSDVPFNLPFLVFQESIITTIDSNSRYVVVFFKSMTDQKAPRIRVGLEGLSPHPRQLELPPCSSLWTGRGPLHLASRLPRAFLPKLSDGSDISDNPTSHPAAAPTWRNRANGSPHCELDNLSLLKQTFHFLPHLICGQFLKLS